MAQPTTQAMVVKAEIDGDMRRVSMVLPTDASPAQILQSIRTTVAQGFEMEEAVLPALKYKDDDGDLCALVRGSVDDMLHMFNGHTLRLFGTTALAEGVTQVSKQSGSPISCSTQDAVTEQEQSLRSLEESHGSVEIVAGYLSAEAVPFVPMEDAPAIDDGDTKEWLDDDFGMDMQVGTIRRKQSDVSGGGQQDAAIPHDQDMQDLHGLAELTAMGFSIEQAQRAMEDAKGNVEMAVGYLTAGAPFVPMEDDVADDDAEKEWPDTDFGMDMQVVGVACASREEAQSCHSMNDQPLDIDTIPCEQSEVPTARHVSPGAEDLLHESSVDVCGAAELIAMGFSKEQARQAMEDAQGDVEIAATMLSSAACADDIAMCDSMNATPLDNAQVLLSTSISKFRTHMSGLGSALS